MQGCNLRAFLILRGLLAVLATLFAASGRPDFESPVERWPPALTGLIDSGASILCEMAPARRLLLGDWFPVAIREWYEGRKAYSYLMLHEPQFTAANFDRLRQLCGRLNHLQAIVVLAAHEPHTFVAELRTLYPQLHVEHRTFTAVAHVATVVDAELSPAASAVAGLFRRRIDWEAAGHRPHGTTFSVRPDQVAKVRVLLRRAARMEHLQVTVLPNRILAERRPAPAE